MSRERHYEILGLKPHASAEEVKNAYRDLAKVWHPDRFAQDPKLQQKAQERLKEINAAYKEITTPGPSKQRAHSEPRTTTATTPPPDQRPRRSEQERQQQSRSQQQQQPRWSDVTTHAPRSQPAALRFALPFLAAVIVGIVIFVYFQNITPEPEGRAPVQAEVEGGSAAGERATESVGESTSAGVRRERKTAGGQGATEKDSGSAPALTAAPSRALPTVSRTIDPTTGLLATRSCPNRMLMTYPSGQEPRESCNADHSSKSEARPQTVESAPAQPARPEGAQAEGKDKSRLKSVVSTITSPGKWFRKKKDKSPERTPGPDGQD